MKHTVQYIGRQAFKTFENPFENKYSDQFLRSLKGCTNSFCFDTLLKCILKVNIKFKKKKKITSHDSDLDLQKVPLQHWHLTFCQKFKICENFKKQYKGTYNKSTF